MNNHKICFIMCSNDDFLAGECELYIRQLEVPEPYEVETLVVKDAVSMTSGYNEAMRASDAKYKVYLHQDVLILNRKFITDMLTLFLKYPDIGMFGVIGNKSIAEDGGAWSDGEWRRNGELFADGIIDKRHGVLSKISGDYEEVIVLDGLLMATQYDIPWRDDLFGGWDFYDCSQSVEFWKAGYKVVVPHMDMPWCLHDNDILKLENYDKWRKIFAAEYKDYYMEWNRVHAPMLTDADNLRKIEKIGYERCDLRHYEIRPEFNTDWYNGSDSYSEGDVEDLNIQIILGNDKDDYEKGILDNFCWSTYYHLTHIRKNLLNWYPFREDASVLEIGCGLGAITNMLCEKCRKVTAVELSKKRATGAVMRCRDKDNLEVIVGNLNDIEFKEKFDYITLIGVLEYQGNFTDTDNPYVDFLKTIKGLLKPNGKLLIAIENKYGLKYWCGAREDHTGVPFDGINQYNMGSKLARTFSKEELSELIKESGYTASYFYYPLPDYKLPQVVYSEGYLPDANDLGKIRPYYVPDTKAMVINEKNVYADLVQNHVFEFFANSFLVECSDEADSLGEIPFATMSEFRKKDYRIGTRIRRDGTVEKFPLSREDQGGKRHISQTQSSMMKLSERGLGTVPSVILPDSVMRSDYVEYPTMSQVMGETYKNRDLEKIWMWYDKLWHDICLSSEEVPAGENLLFETGLDQPENGIDYGKILEIGYVDMIPRNCFVKENDLIWFDQEWKLDKIPAKFVLFRCVIDIYDRYPWAENILRGDNVLRRYGLAECKSVFFKLEEEFETLILDFSQYGMYNSLSKYGDDVCSENIEGMLRRE